jgi:hypothetical protein
VEYRADGGRRALRLAYSPWPIEWEDPAASRKALASWGETTQILE